MEIYQGEPLGGKINVKNDDGTYVSSLTGYSFEAILSNQLGVVASWSTEKGTISIGQETVESVVRGYAAFSIDGNATAELQPGSYTLDVAKVLSNGRAIDVLNQAVEVKPARIRKGI